jgi:hypothetical protein
MGILRVAHIVGPEGTSAWIILIPEGGDLAAFYNGAFLRLLRGIRKGRIMQPGVQTIRTVDPGD